MKSMKRLLSAALCLVLLCSSSALAASKKYKAREITTEIVQDPPDTIVKLLDLAYQQWLETDAQGLGEKNKYTEWRNKYKYGWCGGFITWLMLQLDVPQKEKNKTPSGEVSGIVHVKEAGVGKLYDGYARMNRITRVPQKGFIAVYGNVGKGGTTGYYHVGLVYDVVKLEEGKYRITTIEGNVISPGDDTHPKVGNTVRMFIRDYDMSAAKKSDNLTLVPENERDREENALFSYGYAYKDKHMYINIFLMPWIPGEEN